MSKKKGTPKKSRYTATTVKYDKPERINGVRIENGKISFLSNNEEIPFEHASYEIGLTDERNNKSEKITTYSEFTFPTMDASAILNGFTILIALDTNYKNSFAVSVGLIYLIFNHKDGKELNPLRALVKRFRYAEKTDLELIALNDLIKDIIVGNQDVILEKDKILFVIDHNLGKINKFNNGELPLISGDPRTYLPDRVRLMYASTDKKHDSVFNEILFEADKLSKQILKEDMEALVAEERQG